MNNYFDDRDFTDYVHDKLAVPIIYEQLQWKPDIINIDYANKRDMSDGIDYQATDDMGFKITIQERFRDEFYKNYNDFTIRYTRSNSKTPQERKSEFFKISATHFLYGITNGKKFLDKRDTLTDFVKYIVIDVSVLKKLFRVGIIKVPENCSSKSRIAIENGKKILYTAKRKNNDGSSEFIGIDPSLLKEVLRDKIDDLVILQRGFY
ncbi:hypothetical protein [Streptococcus sp. CSL10205-OR2]|uniref:hypothetical protein n=1 Tax=Streptococcus sp. CSL10205-OR2 TaxID=2980558 RepID=UPI0021D82F95|nr:hypothetical protein [Streptococcus sp. CSL10205-OR2]MCU9534035.1 hypothetical protein [Streptococcus sp. CSL10205-OR2]